MLRIAAGLILAIALAYFPPMSLAEPKMYGFWGAETNSPDGRFYAGTVNDSGNLLGQYCYPTTGNCVWILGTKTSCEAGSTYAILANADSGAASLTLLCNGRADNGLYEYVFTDFDIVDKTVRNATRVGIAFPLKGDEFVVYRFSMQGALTALSVMRAVAETKLKPASRGTRDQRL